MHFEDGLRAIENLVHWYRGREGQRNEATTRLQLINALFLECLGWSKEDVIAEEAHGKEYADYTFLAPRRVLIVEAKREGNYFELPAGDTRLEIPIPNQRASTDCDCGDKERWYATTRRSGFSICFNRSDAT